MFGGVGRKEGGRREEGREFKKEREERPAPIIAIFKGYFSIYIKIGWEDGLRGREGGREGGRMGMNKELGNRRTEEI